MSKLIYEDEGFRVEFDTTHDDTIELMDKIAKIYNIGGYHQVAFWRACANKAEDMIELFESVESSKDEWGETS